MKLSLLRFTALVVLVSCYIGCCGSTSDDIGECQNNEQIKGGEDANCQASSDAIMDSDGSRTTSEKEGSSFPASIESCTTLDCIVSTISTSSTFKTEYWQRKPFLVNVDPSILSKDDALVSWDDLLDVASSGLTWSDNNAAMVSTVKLGDTKDFRFDYSLNGQVIKRNDMNNMAKHSTILIGAVHSIHRGVSKVVLAFQNAFGLIASSNVYSTHPDFSTASPLHTDRMDAFVIQTSGTKKWKVYEPGVYNPIFGVHGDAQWAKGGGKGLPLDVIGELLIDTELKPGSILYLPRGFPHGTSTASGSSTENAIIDDESHQKPSVALTVSLHTESMHLVYEKLLRCALSLAGYCSSPPPIACPIGSILTRYVRSDDGAKIREGLPMGFLSKSNSKEDFIRLVVDAALPHGLNVVDIAVQKDVNIGKGSTDKIKDGIRKAAEMVYDRLPNDLNDIEQTFVGNNDNIPFEERQNHFNDIFGKVGPFVDGFCHPAGARALFSDYRQTEPDDFNSRLNAV